MPNQTKQLAKTAVLQFALALVLFLILFQAKAQTQSQEGLLNSSSTFNHSRFSTVVISEAAVATIATIGLQYLWYKKFPHSRFHFFNDNREWLGMDKLGHATTVYNISALQYNLMRWSGVNNQAAILIGGLTGLGYLAMIEIMDGFSSQWGFSPGDMAANIFGGALFMAQQYGWNEQRIQMRFSFHYSIYAKYNPDLLGRNFPQRLLKDYNGQSYWFSFNVSSFLKRNTNFPKWINADFGIGADGMTGAINNPDSVGGKSIPQFIRQRKLLFGLDGAFTKKNQVCFPSWINLLRIPTPALDWKTRTNEWKLHLLYY